MVKEKKMQTKQLIYRDTVTDYYHITKPKLAPTQEFERNDGFVFGTGNLKKATIILTKDYIKEQVELYDVSYMEMTFIFYLTLYLGKDNILYKDKVLLSTSIIANDMGTSTRNVQRTIKGLVEKKILKKIKLMGAKCYMLNPVFCCFRNNVSYREYYVFMKEVNEFLMTINQGYRIENIQKHFEGKRAEVEREVEIL